MAFSPAGLGGSFARGLMEGMESGRQRREDLQAQRDQEYLQMYSNLLKSGKWQAVNPKKGVGEGGVIKVGPFGFLEPVPEKPDVLEGLNIALKQKELNRQEPPVVKQFNRTGPDGEKIEESKQWNAQIGKWETVSEYKVPPAPENLSAIDPTTLEVRPYSKDKPLPEGFATPAAATAVANLRNLPVKREIDIVDSEIKGVGEELKKMQVSPLAMAVADTDDPNSPFSVIAKKTNMLKLDQDELVETRRLISNGIPAPQARAQAKALFAEKRLALLKKVNIIPPDYDWLDTVKDSSGWVAEVVSNLWDKAKQLLNGQEEVAKKLARQASPPPILEDTQTTTTTTSTIPPTTTVPPKSSGGKSKQVSKPKRK